MFIRLNKPLLFFSQSDRNGFEVVIRPSLRAIARAKIHYQLLLQKRE